MKYATWKLNFSNPSYGTGPEEAIASKGFSAEGVWADGKIEDGGVILGYVEGEPSVADLVSWEFQYLTQEQALAFCLAINPEAYLLENGRIGAPVKELDTPSEITE